jgi:hypothetical protein
MGSSGGGSSGGGSSGKVDYPDYMKDWHGRVLDDSGTDSLSTSITAVMDAALGNSPWAAYTAYDPDADIAAYEAAVSDYATILAGIDYTVDWASFYAQAVATIDAAADDIVDDDVDAYADTLDDELTTKVLPRFRAGMRDVNAVVSSAFVIGQAVIEGFRDRDVARHASKLRVALVTGANSSYLEAVNQMTNLMINRLNYEDSYAKLMIEANRIKIVAKKEESELNSRYDESDALWDLEVFKYGGNMLASIAGAAVNEGVEGPSTGASMIGGALSGAAAGAMIAGASKGAIAGPVGAIIGGVLGAASALL